MAQAKVQFSEHADFTFKDYIKAIKALAKTPRVYGVSLPVEVQSDDLKKMTERQRVLNTYRSDYPNFADRKDWEEETSRIEGQLQRYVGLYNEDLKAKSQEFFDEIKACGCDLTAQYTPQIGTGFSCLAPESKTASCDFVATEVPQFIADNHDVKIIEIQLNKMPAAQRRILVDGTSVFLKQLGDYLKGTGFLNDFGGRNSYPRYIQELSREHNDQTNVLSEMSVEYKGGDSNALNASGTKRINDLANLAIFQSMDVVRAVLIADAFWKKEDRAKDFLETLDALVDAGLMGDVDRQWRHEPFKPLTAMYDTVRPFDTRDTKRTYVRRIGIEIEDKDRPYREWSFARQELEDSQATLEGIKENPDFVKETKRLERDIMTQTVIVEDLSQKWSNSSEEQGFKRAEIAGQKKERIQDELKETLGRWDYDKIDLTFGETGHDVRSTSVGDYKMDATIQATREQMQKINPDDWHLNFCLEKSPSEQDGFDAKAFVEFVNDPSRLQTESRPLGVTDDMLKYFKARDPLVFSVKHMAQKPK